ncbi:unnamed protein product [Arctia plantaginis]|uniref:Uncharacterized protein n=1 Tax=Arctia plantaginis TaxID=874455 RepID=A0A8S1AFS9_ARCPL|nr:unnamed protein product [Arctia plantaginis]
MTDDDVKSRYNIYINTTTKILLSIFICAATYKRGMMRLLVILISVLLAVFLPAAESAPESYVFMSDEIISVTDEFFKDDLIIHRAEYDVVDILFPLNALNRDLYAHHTLLFFVLADFSSGQRVDKGLYVRRDGQITKLLDSARVSTAAKDHTSTAYFGTANGLYHYNAQNNTAERYGTITEGIISLVKANGNDTIYVLTDDYILYKVTDQGTNKERIDKPANVRDIVFDINDNLFLHTSDKTVHIMNRGGLQKIEGLDENPTYLKIYKGPFFVNF